MQHLRRDLVETPGVWVLQPPMAGSAGPAPRAAGSFGGGSGSARARGARWADLDDTPAAGSAAADGAAAQVSVQQPNTACGGASGAPFEADSARSTSAASEAGAEEVRERWADIGSDGDAGACRRGGGRPAAAGEAAAPAREGGERELVVGRRVAAAGPSGRPARRRGLGEGLGGEGWPRPPARRPLRLGPARPQGALEGTARSGAAGGRRELGRAHLPRGAEAPRPPRAAREAHRRAHRRQAAAPRPGLRLPRGARAAGESADPLMLCVSAPRGAYDAAVRLVRERLEDRRVR
ncbi:unnamed protein product [Prorocentrum cordatum]|uniref:Uncharacterized protein n=1 Tax=Prorocentrum cordatum TaxID=2364126 RepID=A0ABN9VU00_9DINO|nr:unnamed protein product [Polarella glacialis]